MQFFAHMACAADRVRSAAALRRFKKTPTFSYPHLLPLRNTLYFSLIDASHPQRYVQSRYGLGFGAVSFAEPGVSPGVILRGLSPVSARAKKPREQSSCDSRKGRGFASRIF
jgi:hypothetical protein